VAPHGFLSVTGLHWLTGDTQRFDDVPGAWSDGPAGVVVALGAGESLTVGGVTVTGEHRFGVVDVDGVEAAFGDAVAEICRRGSATVVRPRHPDSPLRLAYAGTAAHPPDERWIVPGRFVATSPRKVDLGTVVAGLTDVEEAVGRVEFELGGEPLALTVFAEGDGLVAFFGDATSGNRRLRIPAGDVVLDFNRATNPPCFYSGFATCSLPPPENRLPVAIEAGERPPQMRSPVM
jgi:hypothetical protein